MTALIKQGLRDRLERNKQLLAAENSDGIFSNVYNWFVAKSPQTNDHGQENEANPHIFQDKNFLSELRKELKTFEVCIRIFE